MAGILQILKNLLIHLFCVCVCVLESVCACVKNKEKGKNLKSMGMLGRSWRQERKGGKWCDCVITFLKIVERLCDSVFCGVSHALLCLMPGYAHNTATCTHTQRRREGGREGEVRGGREGGREHRKDTECLLKKMTSTKPLKVLIINKPGSSN